MNVKCFINTVISCSLQVGTVLATPYILFLSFLPLYLSLFLHSIALHSCSECALIFSKPFQPPAQLSLHLFLFLSDREEWAVCSPVRSCSHFPYMPPRSLLSGLSASVNYLPLQSSHGRSTTPGVPKFYCQLNPYSQNDLPVPLEFFQAISKCNIFAIYVIYN